MKKEYINPTIEVLELLSEGILLDSGLNVLDPGGILDRDPDGKLDL